ncbi:MAG: EamA family transporter [Stackebrandtia sp.]
MLSSRAAAIRGIVLILVASVCFGVSGSLAKPLINAGLTPLQVTWIRVAGMAVVMILLALPVLRRVSGAPLAGLLGFGLTAIAGVQACYFLAVDRLPVGIALLLEFTGPILVVAWIRWVRRAKLPRAAVAGALLSLAGLAFVVEVWTGIRLDALGLLFGAGAAACQATYFLVGEELTAKADLRILLAVGFGVGAVALTPFAAPWSMDWAVLGQTATLGGAELSGAVIAAALILSTMFAYLLGLPAIVLLSAPVAGGLAYAEVVVAAVAAWLLLGETLTAPQIVGGLIVVAGVFTAQRAVTARPAPSPEPAEAARPT